MRRYLVVANQTLKGPELEATLRSRTDAGPCSFHVVVPATPTGYAWTEGECVALAQERLADAMHLFRRFCDDVTGTVGDKSPFMAVLDALRSNGPVDEIILSTLPAGMSRWLRQDLPNRIRRYIDLPVTHVEAEATRSVKAS